MCPHVYPMIMLTQGGEAVDIDLFFEEADQLDVGQSACVLGGAWHRVLALHMHAGMCLQGTAQCRNLVMTRHSSPHPCACEPPSMLPSSSAPTPTMRTIPTIKPAVRAEPQQPQLYKALSMAQQHAREFVVLVDGSNVVDR